MYLKSLELQGFKSFADKTTLEFKPGITVVIGPNGSGKSNISDAIRWVLGEQSVKALRGSKLEDVIFAGTQARKSVSFAEVDITIDNSDGKLPVDYSEVTVTRRVYRSGESEFYINKHQCRLKDIVELFMDTGIGRDGYSIIGQGRIDEILSSKSEERRHIFEEAVGIVKYRTRKEEAEKKLENTQQNLLRINDIVKEIGTQIGPLGEQAEKAKKYLELRDNLRYIEVGLLISNIKKGEMKLKDLVAQVEEAEGQVNDENEKLANFQTLKEEIRATVETLTNDVEKLQNNIFEVQNSIEKEKADKGIFLERIAHNKENDEKFAKEIEEFKTKITELEQEKEDRKTRKDRLFNDKKRFEEELAEKEAEFNKLSETLTGEQKKIEDLKNNIMKNIDLKFEKMEILSDLTSNLEADTRRIKQIDEEISDNIHELDKEKMKREDALLALNKVTKERNELSSKVDELSEIRLEYSEKVKKFEDDIRSKLSEINVKESRHKFLVETEREFEGYNRAVKEVLTKCQKDKEFGKNICGALASLVSVPSEYETAIEMALGGNIQNVVTETEEDAKRAIEFLKVGNLGRASFLPITAVKGTKLKENLKGTKGFIGIASELIEYDAKYDGVIQNLLGKTAVVDNMENGIAIAKKNKYAFRLVTLDGDIINPSGQMTGGSTFKKTTSILSRAREISELEKIIKKLNKEHEKLVKDLEDYKKNAEEALSEFDVIEQQLQEINISYASENEKMNAIDSNIERMNKKIEMLNQEKTKTTEQIGQIKIDVQGIQDLIANAEKENSEWQIVVDEFGSKNAEQQKIINDLNSDIMDLKISVSSFDESSASMDEIIERIDQDITNCLENVEKREKEKARMLAENEELQNSIAGNDGEIANKENEIKKLEEELAKLKENRENKNAEVLEVERNIEAQFKTLDILREQLNKLEIKKNKIETDIEVIKNKMWEDYETTPNTAQNYAEVTSSTPREVDNLKEQIKALGTINVNAIEEYKALKDRYEFLNTQKEDLEESEKSLNKIIEDMMDLMKIQFAEQFAVINKNFGEVFAELFGGGQAELILADESNILESGIEINVQPPGKKLQNMMLLSGGERALTAIALLFAILKLNPSPFCILDEIEAALDDINVYRYAEYLKKFSKETQFLVITHRKGTMEAANTLYGATMKEHGVTELVSMQLE